MKESGFEFRKKYPSIPSFKEELIGYTFQLSGIIERINSFPFRYSAEKVDGINVQMQIEDGRVVARSRGGINLTKKSGEEYKWLHKCIKESHLLHSFFRRNPECCIFWEYAPPKKPDYLTIEYGDAPFLGFLDMMEEGKFLTYEEGIRRVRELFELPNIKEIPHKPLPKLTKKSFLDMIYGMGRERSVFGSHRTEGLVIKCYRRGGEIYFMKIKEEDVEFLRKHEKKLK